MRNMCSFPIEIYNLEFDKNYLEEEKVNVCLTTAYLFSIIYFIYLFLFIHFYLLFVFFYIFSITYLFLFIYLLCSSLNISISPKCTI